MDELKNLDKKTIKLLHNHQVLYTLIKRFLNRKIVNDVNFTPTEIDNTVQELWERKGIKNEENYLNWIKSNNLIKEQLEGKLIFDGKYNKLCLEKFEHKTEARFLERKSELDSVVYSLIRMKDAFQAREIHLRLKEKESDFSDLAAKYSEGVEKMTRGIIGPVALNKAHPKIIEVLNSIKPGEIYKPIYLENWHLIIRLERIMRAFLDEHMKLQMAKELMVEWVDEQSMSIMNELLEINN